MGIVLQFPNRRRHSYYKCPGDEAKCIEGRCSFCEGGLTYCTTCHQGEGELEDFCPGPPSSGNTQAPEGA